MCISYKNTQFLQALIAQLVATEFYLHPRCMSEERRPLVRDVTSHIIEFIAMEGRIYVASVSGVLRASDIPQSVPLHKYVTEGRDLIMDGGSMVASPGGEIIVPPLIGQEGILYAELSLDEVVGVHMKLDPAGHYSRRDVLRLERSECRGDR